MNKFRVLPVIMAVTTCFGAIGTESAYSAEISPAISVSGSFPMEANTLKQQTPNIVWIMLDHIAFKQLKTHFSTQEIMPTYSRIASEGMEFENALSVCPVCVPARASLLLGQYPSVSKITQNGNLTLQESFDPTAKTYGDYLKEAGYINGYFGKLHARSGKDLPNMGFEGWSDGIDYGNPYSSAEYQQYLNEKGITSPKVQMEWNMQNDGILPLLDVRQITSFAGNTPAIGYKAWSTGVFQAPKEAHEAYLVSDMASKWLEQRKADNKPFSLRVDIWGPHHPYYTAAPFAETLDPADVFEYPNYANQMLDRPKYQQDFRRDMINRPGMNQWSDWQKVIARIYETIKLTDDAAGRVVNTLERLGMLDNTIIIYTADHGDDIGTYGGLFDKGALMIEETMNIPMAVRWPGALKTGFKSQEFVTNMDVTATVLDAVGLAVPADMNSRSMKGIITNPDQALWDEDIMCQHHGHGSYVFQRYIRYKNYKYVAHLDDTSELFDLEKDPYENVNLINDPKMNNVLLNMKRRLIRNMQKYNDNSEDATKLIQQMGPVPEEQTQMPLLNVPLMEGYRYISGTAELNSTISIQRNGQEITTAVANIGGTTPGMSNFKAVLEPLDSLTKGDILTITAKAPGEIESEPLVVSVMERQSPLNYNVRFKVGSNEDAQYIEAGKPIEAFVTVKNNHQEPQKVLIAVGLYDKNNLLVNEAKDTVTLASAGTDILNAGFTLPSDIKGMKVKVMIWEGEELITSKLKPFSKPIQLAELSN